MEMQESTEYLRYGYIQICKISKRIFDEGNKYLPGFEFLSMKIKICINIRNVTHGITKLTSKT